MEQETQYQEKAKKGSDPQMKAAFYGAMVGIFLPLASVATQPLAAIASLAALYSIFSFGTQSADAAIHSDGHPVRDGVKTFATGFGSYVLAFALSTVAFGPADNADTAKIDDTPAVTQQMKNQTQPSGAPAVLIR